MSPWQTYTLVEKEEYSKIEAFIFGKIGWFAASFCKTCRKRFIVRTFCGKRIYWVEKDAKVFAISWNELLRWRI